MAAKNEKMPPCHRICGIPDSVIPTGAGAPATAERRNLLFASAQQGYALDYQDMPSGVPQSPVTNAPSPEYLLLHFVPLPTQVCFNALGIREVRVVENDMIISRSIGHGQIDIAL
jgi:hypothetical protein